MTKKITELGQRIDLAFENKRSDLLENYVSEGEHLENSATLDSNERSALLYYLGNVWSDIDTIKNNNSNDVWLYNRPEHLNAIKYFRKCINVPNVTDEFKRTIHTQAYTNLGNMFSHAGRIIYAIESWHKALKIDENFGMAGCNQCHGLIAYAKSLYDRNHSALILRHAYKGLRHFIKSQEFYPEALDGFKDDIKTLEKVLSEKFLLEEETFRKYSLGKSVRERKYRTWILFNSLYLNPLNDIFYDSVVAQDVMTLPSMRALKYNAPVFQGFYNELKQEFISLRYLFYQYKYELPEHRLHYSDKDRHLVNTLDYPQYGLRYEHLKNSFRMSYSIFDKIAYFLNNYLDLGIKQKDVYFKRIWYEKNSDKILPSIEYLKNLPLRGLYFLSKDFYDPDHKYLSVADPDALEIAEIRNHLEHKYLKIHWLLSRESEGIIHDICHDPLAFSIAEEDFEAKTLRLIKSAREALIYLSLAVHIEELKQQGQQGKAFSMSLIDYDGR
jgi:hypothetical protein